MCPQISYIIPAHNAEKDILRCVDSIIGQTAVSFEIIIVENGSVDKTLELAHSLAEKDNRINVTTSEVGVSNARNKGIEKAQGKYLCFVDQDDCMLPDADKVFARAFEQFDNCDVYLAFSDTQISLLENNWHLIPKSSLKKLLVDSLMRPTKTLTAWGKLFSNELLMKKNIRFDKRLCYSEDSDFVISVLQNSSFAAKINRAVYSYTVNNPYSVRKTEDRLCEKFARAMLITSSKLKDAHEDLKTAYLFYVLDHLLLSCVHDLFRKEKGRSLREQLKLGRKAIREGVYAEALSKAPVFKTTPVKAVIFFFAKHKMVMPLFLASKIRQIQNKTKYKAKSLAK